MKNKVFKGLALLGLVLAFSSCDKKEEVKNISYNLKVVDLDGEELINKKIEAKDNSSLYLSLNEKTNLKASESEYGHFLVSINNSIVDPNYSLMIYENNKLANVGADEILVNEGDEILIRNECWNTISSGYGTFDDNDIIVDKLIYHYIKTELKNLFKNDTTYKGSNYWSYILVDLAKNNGYDQNYFNLNDVKEELKSSLGLDDNMDIADWGKFYFTAKAFEKDIDSFKTKYSSFISAYQSFINDIQTDYSANYAEYSLPFAIPMAKALNVTSNNLEELVNTTYRASTFYGTDALMWELVALQAFDKIEKSELNDIEIKVELSDIYDSNYNVIGQQTNSISTALKLLPFVALGENPRGKKNADNKDLIDLIIEEFYDSKANALKLHGDDEYEFTLNLNQVYASLMAYKVFRDKKKAVNIFA